MDEGELLFGPRQTLEGRTNYKLFVVVERDGTRTERIGLYIPDKRLRETVICKHYLMMLTRNVLKENVGVRIVGRDEPWDFQLELSTGAAFGVEIVSIADNQHQFTVDGKEERRDQLARRPQITLRQLRKFAAHFPDPTIDQLISEKDEAGIRDDDLVENPDFAGTELEGPGRIYLSYGHPVSVPLSERLATAVASKTTKKADKSGLVLIIDNRTRLGSAKPVLEAANTISETLEASPFREIWFYTGYCSDLDGNNSEFTFIPLKLEETTWKAIEAVQSVGT
jgi:hypothetical protein